MSGARARAEALRVNKRRLDAEWMCGYAAAMAQIAREFGYRNTASIIRDAGFSLDDFAHIEAADLGVIGMCFAAGVPGVR